jgi:hypothetical protein
VVVISSVEQVKEL